MKQLTCEMCGSTDLVKQDGVFVCRACGTKYSIEEAKKMMVEGVVSVQGVVKIDTSEEYENYVRLAQDSFEDGRFETAYSALCEALKIAPDNPSLLEKQALTILGKDSFLQTIPNTTTKGLDRAIQLAKTVYSNKELFNFATAVKVDIEIVQNLLQAGFNDEILDLKSQKLEERGALDLLADLGRPVFVVAQSQRDDQVTRQHNQKLESQISSVEKRIQELISFSSSYTAIAQTIIAEIQAAKNKEYWEEHSEEKMALESEKETLQNKISTYHTEISRLYQQGEKEKEDIRKRRYNLLNEKSSLGLFKGKEKKELQDKIDALSAELKAVSDKIVLMTTEIQGEITLLKDRIAEIETELTKNR